VGTEIDQAETARCLLVKRPFQLVFLFNVEQFRLGAQHGTRRAVSFQRAAMGTLGVEAVVVRLEHFIIVAVPATTGTKTLAVVVAVVVVIGGRCVVAAAAAAVAGGLDVIFKRDRSSLLWWSNRRRCRRLFLFFYRLFLVERFRSLFLL
jgi:hypothetical protein